MASKFTRLTRQNERALEPGQYIVEHGIRAEAIAGGDVRYKVEFKADGQKIKRTIGLRSEGVTRHQCEQFVETARTHAREDRLNLPKGRKRHVTFKQGAADYLKRLEAEDGKNIPQKRAHLRNHLVPFFKNQRLDTITNFTVGCYKKRRLRDGAAPASINRELATLSHFLRSAVRWGWLNALPCQIKKEREGEGRIIALSDTEATALLHAAIDDCDPDCWLFVAFGLNTAMRHAEILRTRFEHIDFDRLRLQVPHAKAGARIQPITRELADILAKERESREDGLGWIFPSQRPSLSHTGHRTRMSRPFERAVARATLDPTTITPHVMRHTAITNLVMAGVDLPTIQRISGHKTLAMVLRYTHIHGSHIDKAMVTLGTSPQPNQNNNAVEASPKRPLFSSVREVGQRGNVQSHRENKSLELEARAGIEPTYKDLQFR